MADSEDPLVQALPPATDYLTYLTLLEYQLTPARLPLLHKLLQDETLTTNIGWDLVQMLLPMLPQSQECLQDIARLGNPREVILRVSDALMQLQPEDDDDDVASDNDQQDAAPTELLENQMKNVTVEEKESSDDDEKPLPRHILKFNSLLAMLGVLHSRIETKSPSRFIATSLQAVLESYTLMPTSETTIALLEFFREVSPSKRPAPPPRAASETTVLRVSQASAPDPESESRSATPINNEEPALVRKFLQFGLVELIKSYLLSFSGPMDPGMSWAIRLQEKLHPAKKLAGKASQTDVYKYSKGLRERDMIIAKITVSHNHTFCAISANNNSRHFLETLAYRTNNSLISSCGPQKTSQHRSTLKSPQRTPTQSHWNDTALYSFCPPAPPWPSSSLPDKSLPSQSSQISPRSSPISSVDTTPPTKSHSDNPMLSSTPFSH